MEEVFERILRTAPKDLTDDLPSVVVERWASQMWSIWDKCELIGMDAIEVFAGGLIAYAGKRATPGALVVLRALAAIAPAPYRERARRGAERLAATGVPEPSWSGVVGAWEPTVAWLSYDPVDDDGVNVMVAFEGPGEPSTVGIYIDHNLGGMAKDAFVVPADIDEVLAKLREGQGDDDVAYREITLPEAAARWRAALEMTDMYIEPPTSEDFDDLRALVTARLASLPKGGGVPAPAQISEPEREALLFEFLESDEIIGLSGMDGEHDENDTVEELSHQILTFALDYVVGTPLRFSPVMVEIFCLDWAPRKIAMDADVFTSLPDVLAGWIRFVGRQRGLSESAVREAAEAVYEYAPEMIELSQDPEAWGPAKTMVLAMRQRGIDMSDQQALDDFVDEINSQGGMDVLTASLAGVAPQR